MSSGIMEFPVNGFKQVKHSGVMHLVFFVQYGKLEVTVHESVFTVSTGGVWQVPTGKSMLSLRACLAISFAASFLRHLFCGLGFLERLPKSHMIKGGEQRRKHGFNGSEFHMPAFAESVTCYFICEGRRCCWVSVTRALEARIRAPRARIAGVNEIPCPSSILWTEHRGWPRSFECVG
jgi:hypothetical protein